MRYLVALIIGIAVLFGVNAFAGLFSMPRPWNSLSMGATVGITMVIVLLIWEVVRPSNKGGTPAKPALSEEERAQARAERRARLAAEAGVSPEGSTAGDSTAGDSRADGGRADDSTKEPTTAGGSTQTQTGGRTAVSEAAPAEDTPVAAAPPMRSVDGGDSAREAEEDDPASVADEGDSAPEDDGSSSEELPDAGVVSPDQQNESDAARNEPETLGPDESDEEATGSSLESPPTGEPGVPVDALKGVESADTDGASDGDGLGDESTGEEPDSTR